MVQDQVRMGKYEILLTESQKSLISSFKSKCSGTVVASHVLELNTATSPFQQQDILSGCALLFKSSHSDMSANVDRGFWSRTLQSLLANKKEIQLKTIKFLNLT